MSRSLRRLLARHRRNKLAAWTAARAHSLYRGYENFDYDPQHNGEGFLLRSVASVSHGDGLVLFDVGANEGEWALLAAEKSPGAEIHAFEIVPDTVAELRDRVEGLPNIQVNSFGLADSSGTIPVKIAVNNNTRSTVILHAPIDSAETRELECMVQTGDSYISGNGISRIDLLKIDVEGGENLVLKGLSKALANGSVQAIQFEYGRINATTRFLLADFYALLTPLGYRIGKLYPNYVDFRAYSPELEDFLGPNYVAVHENNTSLREALE